MVFGHLDPFLKAYACCFAQIEGRLDDVLSAAGDLLPGAPGSSEVWTRVWTQGVDTGCGKRVCIQGAALPTGPAQPPHNQRLRTYCHHLLPGASGSSEVWMLGV
eukprot:207901-Chlamydomonas_euryale.AAC.1